MIDPFNAEPYRHYWARVRFKTAMVTICYLKVVKGARVYVCPAYGKEVKPESVAEVIAVVPEHPPAQEDR